FDRTRQSLPHHSVGISSSVSTDRYASYVHAPTESNIDDYPFRPSKWVLVVACQLKEAFATGVTESLHRRSIGTRYRGRIWPVIPPSRGPSIEIPIKDAAIAGWAVDDLSKSVAAKVDIVLDYVPYA